MAIKTPTRPKRGTRRTPMAPAGQLKGALAHGHPRQRSPSATSALDGFDGLRRFFAQDVQLAKALGWDAATVADWRAHQVVRPQQAKIAQVTLLDRLCQEARPFLRADTAVGEWLNAPLPNLGGATPAEWIRSSGRTGLRQLVYGMVDWMPRVPAADLEPVDERDAIARLEATAKMDPGAREVRRMLGATARTDARLPKSP